jgi:hypothetical protein
MSKVATLRQDGPLAGKVAAVTGGAPGAALPLGMTIRRLVLMPMNFDL